MKFRLALMVVALVGAGLVGKALQADDAKKEKEFACKCVVSGQDAKEESSVEYKGKKVYFCCDNCPAAFEKDPEKFATLAHHQFLVTGQMLQVACPFTGQPVNPDTVIDIEGASIGFCCEKCQAKAEAAENKIELCFADISKGYTLQTECPVSGKAVDITKVLEHDGQKVYFCCGNCPAAFKKDPSKYVDKLPQFAKAKKTG